MSEEIKNNTPETEETEKTVAAEEAAEEKKPAKKAKKKGPELNNPDEAVKELSKGKLKLFKPFTADDEEITELEYDFENLGGPEMVRAMDRGAANGGFQRRRGKGGAARNGFFRRIFPGGERTYYEIIMELSVVTHTSVTDFMQLSWRQIQLMREAFITVMKAKKAAQEE